MTNPWSVCISSAATDPQITSNSVRNPLYLDDDEEARAAAVNAALRYISYEEVQRHNTRESCWVVVDGQVYDATEVLAWHPAGAEVILQLAGKDAT